MIAYSWNGLGGYDRFVKVDAMERDAITAHFDCPGAQGWGWGDGFYFYLVSDEKYVVTPLLKPSLAFSGQWNGYPPYGDITTTHFSIDTLSEYRLEMDWQAPK